MFNRLTKETSPYLLQHRDNPVDWYPWCDEAFETARRLDRPILLSIGYSACHWCHVMAHECFEDELIAQTMNNGFVNIKVDREELPDVDSIYMTAVQAMTGSGGWPLTVFITPDGKPFFGGTYFPPTDHHNRPGFPRVLNAITDAYKNNRGELLSSCEQLLEVIRGNSAPQQYEGEFDESLMFKACDQLLDNADLEHGGSLGAPKFPQPMLYELLLRYAEKTGNSQASHVVNLTLEKMAQGGIYDQIGGGFARYSVDDKWLVPHFEKMLYDNAQLVTLYAHAYQMTRKPLFKKVIEQTLGYVVREMTHSMGGFYSSSDADSEGVEGKFFVWTSDELDLTLNDRDASLAKAYWQVTDEGNFDGANILNVPVDLESFAQEQDYEIEELKQDISRIGAILFKERSRRVPPGIDDKILTSWNALMFKAFAEAGALFNNLNWINIAVKNARFLLFAMKDHDGRLLHSWKAIDNSSSDYEGGSRILGYLDDHAYFIDGLITLYEATFDDFYVEAAQDLADSMVRRFWDGESEVFYDTSPEHPKLIVRPRDILDNAVPSGGSIAALSLLRLSSLTGNSDYRLKAESSVRTIVPQMRRAPLSVTSWISAADFHNTDSNQIVLIGNPESPAFAEIITEIRSRYLPNLVLAGSRCDVPDEEQSPLLRGKKMLNGKPTAFVCADYVCKLPVNTASELADQLD